MAFIDVIKNSVASSMTEGSIEMRRKQVELIEPRSKRMALQAIDAVVFAIPEARHRWYRRVLQERGMSYVGAGAESVVVRNGASVIKYVIGSDRLSIERKVMLRDEKREYFDRLQTCLGPYVLDQLVEVAPHILTQEREFVQTVQPFINFDSIISVGPNRKELITSSAISGSVADQLSDFIDDSWRLYGADGILPDMNGIDNLVLGQDGRIILIDTQPVGADQPDLQELIKIQLRSLVRSLDDSVR